MQSSQRALFTRRVGEFCGKHPPLTCRASARLADVVGEMAARGESSALVVDENSRLVGIFTENDVARRVVFRLGPEATIEQAMTWPVATCTADDYLYRAVARMRRRSLRHMPVVDAARRPIGILDLHEALAATAERLMDQVDALTQESTLEGLALTKKAQAELAGELLVDNLPAPEIQGLITDINHDIHRRILDALVAAMAQEGWGDPPVPCTLLIMGSGGRGENFLFPDQDNGFILADYPDDEHNRIDRYFVALAERFNLQLDAVGFPLCKGHVMARNPLWRKTARQWREQIALWAQRRSPAAILFSDIMFDFRPIWGPDAPAAELREFTTITLKTYPALLAMMCKDETKMSVALGFFGRIVTDHSGDHPGRVDLKLRGTMPLVAAARLWALKEGVAETSTLARLGALAERGIISRDERAALDAAFNHVTFLLLRQQLADFAATAKVGNYVELDKLSSWDKDLLRDALRAIEHFRVETRSAFTGAVF
ncbi:MAG TPA: DUF294 nucleotidyltransferase-like domain-containing protein [Alphaproteobacteria bacterium]|nr:DUF294 nucleotidyltransferase-like domain-containing protein [Alphaproteobacteria bacterium]